MQIFNKYYRVFLENVRRDPLSPVWFALLSEFLLLGYMGFAILFSLETLLPTFVSVRLSLAKFLLTLLILTSVLLSLGRILGLSFPLTLHARHPLVILGGIWACFILLLSIMKFPLWTIPILTVCFMMVLSFFLQMFLEEGKGKEK